jgi:hypothetical protein
MFVLLVGIGLAIEASASAQTESDFEIWTAAFFTGQLFSDTPTPTLWFDAQARRSEVGTVLILRPGIGVALAPWASVWLGYAWTPTWLDDEGGLLDEHRIWEQLTLDFRRVPGLLLQSRTRLEQRFRPVSSGTSHRFREFVRVNYRPTQRLPVGIAFYDEVFLGISGAGWAAQGFDQNRAFLGLAIFALEALFRVEVGYLNVFLSREPNRIAHVLSLNFFVSYGGRSSSAQETQ